MSRSPDLDQHFGLPAPLADYADWLLLGTDLDAAGGLLIASGQLDVPAELQGLADALRAGLTAEEDAA